MIAICLGINQKVQTESNVLSNLGLENIEALTNGENGGLSDWWDSKVYTCANVVIWQYDCYFF